ncbi:MFS transporter [Agitococcus lubricus]|uniref:Putative MFS family arabinose efflux permease n=1 Tax=Agitococcus lubricus TaxID=1077255 RepID=A0A2T5J258_9GAMM|nr:MFS transporter [Agitococcus lubricus]PTQ90608.1 putative MFS family arabinose efflux permease [Agitococcus lubricus]
MNNEQPDDKQENMSGKLIALMAVACGLTVANLYYAQPLVNVIAPDLGLASSLASLIVTLTQLGYCVGLLLLVPLGDLIENRQLVISSLSILIAALLVASSAVTYSSFMIAMTVVGLSAVAVQMLVPIAAHFAPAKQQGHIVGLVMSGLFTGIMLARPIASLITDTFGWRVLYSGSASIMALLVLALFFMLPSRQPKSMYNYPQLLLSLVDILRHTPLLRWRAAYQAALFAAFTLFWTAVPILLASPMFNISQRGIALFALIGATGAFIAPIAGMLADRGWGRLGTVVSLLMVLVGFLLTIMGAKGSIAALVIAAVLIDMGVQANLVFGQRILYALDGSQRSRLNGLYMSLFFVGGALGSAIASSLYLHGGWLLVAVMGALFPLIALVLFFIENGGF